jgi:RNA polymerase sigma-70 factor (ECF subfamily)
LPEEQRTVLLLVTVEELPYVETAKVLDIPVGTVMSRLSRPRDRLLRLMSDEAQPERVLSQLRRVK